MRYLVIVILAAVLGPFACVGQTIIGSHETGRTLSAQSGTTASLRLNTVEVPVAEGDFQLTANGRTYTPKDFRITKSNGTKIEFSNPDLTVTVEYTQANLGALRKVLHVAPKRELTLERLDVERLKIPGVTAEIARSESEEKGAPGFPICGFLESKGSGAFFSLDFAYSEISWTGNLLSIGYQPFVKLKAGEAYESHAVTFQAYRLAGTRQGAYDSAAAEAFRRYIRFDYAPPHLNAPQFFYTSIVNRFTEVDKTVPPSKEGEKPIRNTIFYTLSDANYYMLQPEKIPEEIDFCKSLSMDVCQLYEGPFEWIAGNPAAALAKRIGEYARDRGVKLGLYTGANQLTAPHFNHYAQDKGRPEWKLLTADGKRGAYCWGSQEFARWFTDILIETSLNFNFQDANFDFLKITACFDPKHGHAVGENGIYKQVLNLVASLDAVRAAVPGYVYDSNLGWPPFVPKIAKSMDAFYLTDPHFTTYFPSLNATVQLDNSRRYQMVSYFLNHLTPVEYFRNCEYFVVPDSVVPDSKTFEFGILQGLALTPNLQLGEARALFDRFSPSQQESARRFLARWTSFVRQNFELYADTRVLTGMPKLGPVEIYTHSSGNRRIAFLVNPNPFPAEAVVRPAMNVPYRIHELYPEDRYLSSGETFTSMVPARTVRVLEIAPKPAYSKTPLEITGAPASYDRFPDHYRVTVEGNQGDSRTVVLALPEGEKLTKVESAGQSLPIAGGSSVAVLFPKEKVEEQIQNWVIQPATLEQGTSEMIWKKNSELKPVRLPQLEQPSPFANFLGSRIENLLNERYSRELLVYFEPGATAESTSAPVAPPPASAALPQGTGNNWWYSARFPVAYVQKFIPPAPSDHNYISLNFAKPGEVSEIKVWLNGEPVPVETYQYWRGPAWAKNFYIDGTKHGLRRGENTMSVFVRYAGSTP
ncbi:MAG: hypothetical protein ABI822_02910 [Bryobacteraceae bacterium]